MTRGLREALIEARRLIQRYIITHLRVAFWRVFRGSRLTQVRRLNLCSGSVRVPGYFSIDVDPAADMRCDLELINLPFSDNSIDAVICISAINYFTRNRAKDLVQEVFRVLRPAGIARFGTQDLELLCRHYLNRDTEFFHQKLPDGSRRFPGETLGEIFMQWFYGFPSSAGPCKYVYDYETLASMFRQAGFQKIERKNFGESLLPEIAQIDNRPDQMFFLEAVKGGEADT